MTKPERSNIVIIGGGVIGCCSAFYLSRHPSYDSKTHCIIVIEATTIAGGASGKAGGCLGTWAEPACLADASFRLHAELAEEHGGESWGYRKCTSADCDTVNRHAEDGDADTAVPRTLNWLDRTRFKWYKPLGETAQVHPYLFTTMIANLAREQGVEFIDGSSVDSIVYSQNREAIHAVLLHDAKSGQRRAVPARQIIVAAGPWTQKLIPEAPIGGEKSHSIVVRPKREISPTILFFDPGHIEENDAQNQLEIYPRPDRTVYMCGQTDFGLAIPPSTDDVEVDLGRCKKIMETASIVSQDLAQSDVLTEQTCFRPIVNVEGRDPEMGPLLGHTGIEGLILAAGHNHWGIQNAPITGKVVSELVFDGRAISADVSQLDPREHLRFT